ncbi:Late embryogenesis abundant [Olea europaea subsp. europaea]|uniref:Late embryogenesis abundant n=1 Tax=Olea europaea subsp. europaea TaxID=158383 RepID=A0A8S0TJ83_OLEEU|nr:Late embryogenesis abundant [Olea europaea subsp. europaea]
MDMEEGQQQQQQMRRNEKMETEEQHKTFPLESSPYLKYSEMEEYKRQGYGMEAYLSPKSHRTTTGTDAPGPTISAKEVAGIDRKLK